MLGGKRKELSQDHVQWRETVVVVTKRRVLIPDICSGGDERSGSDIRHL